MTKYLGGALLFVFACNNPQHGLPYSGPDATSATTDADSGSDGSGSGSGSGTSALDCSTRPPPAGWTRLATGKLQNFAANFYLFDIADATKYANMWGFNSSAAPVSGGVVQAPYVEPEGPPPPIIRPVFPAHAAANALFSYGPSKTYYSLELTMPTFPDPSGAQSISFFYTGSSTNYGAVSTVSLSECPGDFSPELAACMNPHFFGEAQSLYAQSNLPPNGAACQLEPGKTYYFNIAPAKNGDWTQSSCPAGQWCWTTVIETGQNCIGAPYNNCEPLMAGM